MRSRSFRILIGLALLGPPAHAQNASLVGSWRGTSVCADREHWPACKDEQVIYDARVKPGAPDTVTVRADKMVNGARENMGESDFVRAADSSWVSELQMGRSPGRIVLRIVGTRMTGTMIDVPTRRTVRTMSLDRAP